MGQPLRLLLLEDNPRDAELVLHELRQSGLEPQWRRVDSESAYLAALATPPDLILSDYEMPQFTGLRALELLRQRKLDIPFIIVSGTIGEEVAVSAMRQGADDFLLKDRLGRIGPAITHALARKQDRLEKACLEARVRESEQRARLLVETVPDIIFAVSTDGHITLLNPAFDDLTGWRREEWLGKNFQSLVHPEDLPLALEAFRGCLTGAKLPLELRIRRASGEFLDVEFTATSQWEGTAVVGVMGIGRDITERKRTREELRETSEHLQSLLAASPTVIFTLKVIGGSLVPAWVSENMVRITGFTAEEALQPQWWQDHLHPEDRERTLAKMAVLFAEGRLVHEYRFGRKDGTFLWVHDQLRLLRDASGKPVEIIGSWTDITELRLLEAQARRSQRLEALGTLAGGVAHDLNNALAPIMMAVELLRMEYPGESRTLDTVQTSAKRCADMVRQLLTFAKGAEGKRVSIQPRHLLKEMEKIIKGTFPKNIRLEFNHDPELPTVRGDATQLHQVLLNLCVNARDAMPEGGTLTLEAQRVEVDAATASAVPEAKPGPYVALRVLDTGTGIPPEILDRIFDPFFTTKGPDKGTGLGLSTVMGIVKGHEGFLQVHSSPGQGSTFAVYLPAELAGSGAEFISKTEVAFRGQGELILFVDDEAGVRSVARSVLGRLNFKALTAGDGADALIQAAEHRTELRAVISDLQMPQMDGLAFVRALRPMLPELPVVIASGRLEDPLGEEFKALGVTARLDKPFTQEQLADVLRDIFGRA